MEAPLQEFLCSGSFDFDRLWSFPASAEFFCGDGRIAAGHFALLRRLRREGHLDQVIAFDRLDPKPPTDDWQVRDREMAERLLAAWDRRHPLLVITGGFHAQVDATEGETMAAYLARELPGLQTAMFDYPSGNCWSRGEATPALVPRPGPKRLERPHVIRRAKRLRRARLSCQRMKSLGRFFKRLIRAVRIAAKDTRIPRPLRWLAALGLLPIPGPFDEVVLVIVAVPLALFYRGPLTEAWQAAYVAG